MRTVPPVSPTTEATDAAVPASGPPYATHDDLTECDGLALGSPTRFGNMAAPLKHFLDGTSALWLNGALDRKPAAVFSSTSSMHGGQESTLLTMMVPLLHHGMYLVGLPFTAPALNRTRTGGSPYGATHLARPGSRHPPKLSDDERELAQLLGQRLANSPSRRGPRAVADELRRATGAGHARLRARLTLLRAGRHCRCSAAVLQGERSPVSFWTAGAAAASRRSRSPLPGLLRATAARSRGPRSASRRTSSMR